MTGVALGEEAWPHIVHWCPMSLSSGSTMSYITRVQSRGSMTDLVPLCFDSFLRGYVMGLEDNRVTCLSCIDILTGPP